MHGPMVSPELVDDFVILRARAFTSQTRRTLMQGILPVEGLSLLEWQLLFSIARFGSCHMARVTSETSIDPAHGSRAASGLERKQLITRMEDPHNRRRKLLSLTEQGKTVFRRVWPQVRQVVSDKTDRLSESELAELKRLLDVLNAVDGANSAATDNKEPRKCDIYLGKGA